MSISTRSRWAGGRGRASAPGIPRRPEQDYRAMVEGLRDYLGKSGFSRALLGLSGGVDSALVAAIAADALGPEAVRCVMLPSEFTCARELARTRRRSPARSGCRLDELPIEAGAGGGDARRLRRCSRDTRPT